MDAIIKAAIGAIVAEIRAGGISAKISFSVLDAKGINIGETIIEVSADVDMEDKPKPEKTRK